MTNGRITAGEQFEFRGKPYVAKSDRGNFCAGCAFEYWKNCNTLPGCFGLVFIPLVEAVADKLLGKEEL